MIPTFDPNLPLARASTPPASWYTDSAFYGRERKTVFARSWQCLARSTQLAEPGSYVSGELAGEPYVLVRGEDRVLRGFFNVCRHRAAPVCPEAEGSTRKFRCPYHGWTYDLSGRLLGVPEFRGVECFDRETSALLPLGAVEEWGGFVWGHFGPVREPLHSALDPLPAWWAKQPAVDQLAWVGTRSYDLDCNWKVYVDNYLDGGYHVHAVHPGLAGVIDYSQYRIHVYDRTSLQATPLQGSDGPASRTRQGEAGYWWIYPNYMINVADRVMDTNWVLPLGPDRCRVIFDYYFDPGADEQFRQESLAVAHQIQVEDVTICEAVQRGLASQAFVPGRYSVEREAAQHRFHVLLAQALSEGDCP